ncbi:MAG: FHA domain-containing protein [Pseudomonadota bacterium]
MRILLVTQRSRAGSDEVSRRETVLDHDPIRIGRGAPMEINLPEIDVDYHHATLTEQGGSLTLTGVGENGLMVGKKRQDSVVLTPGTAVEIGRHRFTAETGRDGADHVLVMEVLPAKPVRTRREKRSLAQVLPGRRPLAWVACLAILGGLVIWPMLHVFSRDVPAEDEIVVTALAENEVRAAHPIEALWSSGPMSKAHAGIGGDCGACHLRPFEQTTSAACLSCHATVTTHALPEGHSGDMLAEAQCSDCHKEHNGGERPVVEASTGCTNCHGQIASIAPNTNLRPISGFQGDHPNFEPAVITEVAVAADGTLQPVLLPRPFPENAVLQEKSGLRFPHDKHLSADGVVLISGKQRLTCNDCHQTEADGNLMRPIKMERDCGGCHIMEFAPAGTGIALPHADEAGIAKVVRGYFEARLAEGSVEIAQEQPRSRRRLAGKATQVAGAALTQEWVEQQTEAQLDAIFGKRLCATCHEAQKVDQVATATGWQVQPALLQRHWMPRAEFSHKSHEEMDCAGCHAARQSKAATDVLMPQISVCRDCHMQEGQPDPILETFRGLLGAEAEAQTAADGAEPAVTAATTTKVDPAPATCVTCHGFHLEGEAAMSPAHAEAWAAMKKN